MPKHLNKMLVLNNKPFNLLIYKLQCVYFCFNKIIIITIEIKIIIIIKINQLFSRLSCQVYGLRGVS